MSEKEQTPPPVPYYPSRRFIGIELELDASQAIFHEPTLPQGWVSKADGSCHNGREYVLEPPQPIVEAKTAVEQFSAETIKAKMHVGIAGGYHIHVQIHDYTKDDATRLAQLYWRYQLQIDELVAPSRRSDKIHTHIAKFDSKPTKDYLVQTFQLDLPAPNRQDARLSRQKMYINFAMMRCNNPLHRSAEFRQPSPSKRVPNIYGWACFACALTEIALNEKIANRFINVENPTWRTFLALLRRIERTLGVRDLVEWAKWRRDYLNHVPTGEVVSKMYGSLVSKAHGLFYISRKINTNLTATKKLVENEVAKGRLMVESPGRYRVRYEAVAPLDLKRIIANWEALEVPAQATPVPARQVNTPPTNVLVPTNPAEQPV